MPKSATVYKEELKSKIKIPFWYFIGLIAVGCLILILVISIKLDNNTEAKYLANPQTNDIYYINSNDGYTCWKLTDIEKDTLIFHTAGSYVESIFDMSDIPLNSIYLGDTLKYNRSDIKRMFEENDIYQIERE